MKESNDRNHPQPEMTEVVLRSLQGAASQPEEEQLRVWLEGDPQNRTRFEEIRGIWERTAFTADAFTPDPAAAWEKVRRRTVDASVKTGGATRMIPFPNWAWSSAASLLLLLGIGYVFRDTLFPSDSGFETFVAREPQRIYLPDSSAVWLNRNSRLSWSDFKGETREVKLDGEAFFEVRRRTEQPFRVQGLKSLTEVLGTSFELTSRKGQPEVLEVVTGKVAFSSLKKPENRDVFLPGEKGNLDETGTMVKSRVENRNAGAWHTRKLDFENTPLPEVAETLEQYFGIRIHIEDSTLQRCRFTGSFDNPRLSEVFQVLQASTGLKLQEKNQDYFLSGGGCL